MKTKPIKLVFFDLGNVLVHVQIERFYNNFARLAGISKLQVIELTQQNVPAIRDFNRGIITPHEFYRIVCGDFNNVTFQQFIVVYTDIFSLNNETIQLASKLKEQVRISIISNTDELHFEYILKQFPVIEMFANPVLSYKVKATKPNPEIYHYALQQANCKPEECIFIDDLSENITAANAVGMNGIVYTTTSDLIQKLHIYNLNTLYSQAIGGF